MQLKPSFRFGLWLVLMHGLTFGVLWFLSLPGWLAALLGMSLIVSAIYYLMRDVLGNLPGSWQSLAWQGERLVVKQHNGQQLAGMPARESVVCRHFVVLGLRTATARLTRWRVIFPDALDPESFRRLVVALTFSPLSQGDSIVGTASGSKSG